MSRRLSRKVSCANPSAEVLPRFELQPRRGLVTALRQSLEPTSAELHRPICGQFARRASGANSIRSAGRVQIVSGLKI